MSERPADLSLHGARPIFTADRLDGADELGRGGHADLLAELLVHGGVETPMRVALFGGAGTGKSFFLNQMLQTAAGISAGAARLGAASPFLADALVVSIEARPGDEPDEALADAVFKGVAVAYPTLATETRHAGANPIEAARDASERLNQARRQLDGERQTLEGLSGREARLTETVLFDQPGSRVDAYARTNRSRIERALRTFGFPTSDPVVTYKELVREAAESRSAAGPTATALRSLWGYPGQTRLIVFAILLAIVAWGVGALMVDRDTWLASIREIGQQMAPAADWAQAHIGWLKPVRTVAVVLAVVLLVLNLSRAMRFTQPIFKGVSLLRYDVDARRRDLNGLLAHQTRRVDGLAAEVETASIQADQAEKRASAHRGSATSNDLPVFGPAGADKNGREAVARFFGNLSAVMAGASPGDKAAPPELQVPMDGAPRALENRRSDVPRRIIVALDGLDRMPAEAAARFVSTADRLLGPGFVLLLACDRNHLSTGFADTDPALAAAQMDRTINVAFKIAPSGASHEALSRFASGLLQGATGAPHTRDGKIIDAGRSVLDVAWNPNEAETVAALAPFAGDSPRATKRYVNLYRIARADPALRDAPAPVFTALALALALDQHGLPEDLTALEQASHGETHPASDMLRDALAAARTASGEPVELGQAQLGLDVARRYTSRG